MRNVQLHTHTNAHTHTGKCPIIHTHTYTYTYTYKYTHMLKQTLQTGAIVQFRSCQHFITHSVAPHTCRRAPRRAYLAPHSLYVCMLVCGCLCLYVYMHVSKYIHIHMGGGMHQSADWYGHMRGGMHQSAIRTQYVYHSAQTYTHNHITPLPCAKLRALLPPPCVCMYVRMYVCMYVSHTHTHTHHTSALRQAACPPSSPVCMAIKFSLHTHS